MNDTPYRQFVKRNGGGPAFKQPGNSQEMNRIAITIHVIPVPVVDWVWELRNLDGSVLSDSNRAGEYSVFANPIEAFDDASENARIHFNKRIEDQLIEMEG